MNQTGGTPEPPHPNCHRLKQICIRLWRGFVRWLSKMGVLELFTGILAFSTLLQLLVFIRSERAFVYVEPPSVVGQKISSTRLLQLQFAIKNSGHSAGFVIDSISDVRMDDKPLPQVPSYVRSGNAIKGPVVPNGVMYGISHAQLNGHDIMLPQDLVDEINAGTMHLYSFGYFTYRDEFSFIFGNTTIGYCWVLNTTVDPNVNIFNSCDSDEYIYVR